MSRDESPPPPWQRPKDQTGKRKAQKQEQGIAKRWGGAVQPASGAVPGRKGDVKLVAHLAEAKITASKRFTLTLATWLKCVVEAGNQGRTPIMVIEFEGYEPLVLMRQRDADAILEE